MRDNMPSKNSALTKATDAWNGKVRALVDPLLQRIFASVGNLQRLRATLQRMNELEVTATASDGPDCTAALKELTAKLQHLQKTLDRLDNEIIAAAQEGDSLMDAFLALPAHEVSSRKAARPAPRQARTHSQNADRMQEVDANVRALKRLIEARRGDIEALNVQLGAAERLLKTSSELTAKRTYNQIDLHNVQEFLQSAPDPPVPVQLSHYQRILNVANSTEGRKLPMGTILTAAGIVTDHQLQSALDHQRSSRRRALGIVLVDLGYTTEEAVAQALAAQLNLPFVLLANEPVNSSAVETIPVHMARRHACIPLNFTGHALCVAMANPLDLIALEDLRIAARNHIRPYVATRSDIVRHIERYYGY